MSNAIFFEDLDNAFEALLPTEERLLRPFQVPVLETFRTRLLGSVNTKSSPAGRARSVLLLAYRTSVRGLFEDIIPVTSINLATPSEALSRPQIGDARYPLGYAIPAFDVAKSLEPLINKHQEALEALTACGMLDTYRDRLEAHLGMANAVSRVSAQAALALFAAVLLHKR